MAEFEEADHTELGKYNFTEIKYSFDAYSNLV